MRLIDADALTDNFIRHYTEQERKRQFSFTPCEIKQGFADMICEAPTVDAVEVVRCGECRHFCPYEGAEHKGDCAELVGLESCVYDDGFCSYGERRYTDGKTD